MKWDDPAREKLFRTALAGMGLKETDLGPGNLDRALEFGAERLKLEEWPGAEGFVSALLQAGVNHPMRELFASTLRRWDNLARPEWGKQTERYTPERRALVHELLGIPQDLAQQVDDAWPPGGCVSAPIVIATSHEEWYTPQRRDQRSFYWDAYSDYLKNTKGWKQDPSIDRLHEACIEIVGRMSDPERRAIFQTRGLVVGHVQSGKTANFTGVIAKAADAGYRLIIVLAGTVDVLREQTQRRLDKEMIGRELLEKSSGSGLPNEYRNDPDWGQFIAHGDLPSVLGSFDWSRLTGGEEDYKALRRGLDALEFVPAFRGRPLNHPANLHQLPARLIVIKKNVRVLRRLTKDLERLRTDLEEIPAVVIDDESDQASINTKKPTKKEQKERTATNAEILKLLDLLPRAQYVGYTATPFANVLIDPSDNKDLFPKDYIVALPRPDGYMGARDFLDLDEDGRELTEDEIPKDFESKRRAFVRDIAGDDTDPGNLPEALDAFVLAGASKLYRADAEVSLSTRHHTMLVHRSVRQKAHDEDAELVRGLFDAAQYSRHSSRARLRRLWETNFAPVSAIHAEADVPQPADFDELLPFIDEAVTRIKSGGNPVFVVNGDGKHEDDTPDFDRDDVWKILVGGAKLSRGYTVEGLTISYYTRKIKTADTLMQVGRWFGFRHGYRDLVRLYLAREVPDGRGTMDLYEAFKSICLDEEAFRRDLARYSADENGNRIRPEDVPPLVPAGRLVPTARNKMYHARLKKQNFGGDWAERVMAPTSEDDKLANAEAMLQLLADHPATQETVFGISDEERPLLNGTWTGRHTRLEAGPVIEFLDGYRWLEGEPLLQRHVEFLEGTGASDPGITHWTLIAPQVESWTGATWGPAEEFRTVVRARIGTSAKDRMKAYSERRHRAVAEYLAGLTPKRSAATDATRELQDDKSGVFLLYPVLEKAKDNPPRSKNPRRVFRLDDKLVTIGFALLFPRNKLPYRTVYGVDGKA